MLELFIQHASYFTITMALLLTGFGLPLPEELVVVFSAVISRHGELNPYLAYLACLVGALSGDSILYWLGWRFGRNMLRDHRWFARFIPSDKEKQLEGVIQRHGLKVLCVARLLVGVRSAVYVAAGVLHVPFRRLILVDAICASLLIGLTFSVSYHFADQITAWFHWIRSFQITLTVVLVALVLILIGRFWQRRRLRWQRVLERRATRRGVLLSTGTAAAEAANGVEPTAQQYSRMIE